MDNETLMGIQQKVSMMKVQYIKSLHDFRDIPNGFKPWESDLSPSALYNCSLTCRKMSRIKTPESKWMSIKRWVTVTPFGINLPSGVFLSIKRREQFINIPIPHFNKQEFIVMMFPYGNVWSQISPDVPITEEWLYTSDEYGILTLQKLMDRDAAMPLNGYFKSCHKFMTHNPDQVGIHLKRKNVK